VPEVDVVAMNRRLSAQDLSLNVTVGGGDGGDQWQDWLVDDAVDQEVEFARAEESQIRRKQLNRAMRGLKAREKRIFILRRLEDDPMTLEALSRDYGISRERVRQIEGRAYEKVRKSILKDYAEQQRAVRATLESCAAAAGR
jgi:RNA polymerase sigma-32 factor